MDDTVSADAPGPHEGDRPDAVGDQVGEQVGDLGGRRPAYRRLVLAGELGERRLPEREQQLAPRRPVVGHRDDLAPDQPAGGHLRLGHGRGREHEHRVGAVVRADPSQPPQHRRDVRAEHPAVAVALVDDDDLEVAQEPGPPRVPGQDRPVQHVGVGEHVRRVLADPVARLDRGVAVVGRGADRLEPQPGHRPQLVGGQGLGGGEVQRRRRRPDPAPVGGVEHPGQRGQQVAERLAGGGAGGDHRSSGRPGRARLPRPGGSTAPRHRTSPARRPGRDAPSPASRPDARRGPGPARRAQPLRAGRRARAAGPAGGRRPTRRPRRQPGRRRARAVARECATGPGHDPGPALGRPKASAHRGSRDG